MWIPPKRSLARVALILFLCTLPGCSYLRGNRESLNKFSSGYVAFRKAANDCEVVMWVIALDQSERTGSGNGTFYRRYFARALDVSARNRDRADAAKQALKYHDTRSPLEDFDKRNEALEGASLVLVESANAIESAKYRQKAAEIAESSLAVRRTFDALRDNFVSTYDLQVDLLTRIADENGDLAKALASMNDKISEKHRLEAEGDQLRKQERSGIERLQEQYAAFKGAAGLTVDYLEPANN